MNFEPDILKFNDNNKVGCISDFEIRRKEMLDILAKEEYGYFPERLTASGRVIKRNNKCQCGFSIDDTVEISIPVPDGKFCFNIHHLYPANKQKVPTIVFLNFRNDVYDIYCPVEELLEKGFSLAILNYKDIASDDGDFNNGLASHYPRTGGKSEWGKIGMWAFGASAVADYLLSLDFTDENSLAVIGHSRLGKTALWCGANDERFKFVISNDSGCSGAAYERVKSDNAETIKKICDVFPFWFCENYKKYGDTDIYRPFDQHFLLSCICPRYVLVGSAEDDNWADPGSEKLSCIGASPVWGLYNKTGYTENNSGNIHYHIRKGVHFLGRPDWLQYTDFILNNL